MSVLYRRVVLTHEAANDLKAVALFTRLTWEEDAARCYYDSLVRGFSSIAQAPETRSLLDAVPGDVYRSHWGHHSLYFSLTNQVIHVLRLLHHDKGMTHHLDI